MYILLDQIIVPLQHNYNIYYHFIITLPEAQALCKVQNRTHL